MIKTPVILLFAILICLCSTRIARANATITLSWDGGPTIHPNPNRTLAEGSVATVVATATGFDQPVVAFSVRIEVLSRYDGMPDAWRFDTGGCADGGFGTPEIAIDSSCPFLSGTNPLTISYIRFINGGDWGKEVCMFAHASDAVAVSQNARYTIAQFQFDMTKGFAGLGLRSGSCGCVDQPQAVHIVQATWLGADGVEYSFDLTNECLAWEDPTNSIGCPYFSRCDIVCPPNLPPQPKNPCSDQQPTGALARSWGAVKALYR